MRDGTEDGMTSEDEWDEDISDDELQARWQGGVPVEVTGRPSGLLLETNMTLGAQGRTWHPGGSPVTQPPRISSTSEPKVSA